ncbi:hypothetical protein VDGD_04567 [Verticillium dahliae]|nr:hypothetical protein VdG1_08001 [Verticillium dahliae VDG1]RBQ86228.1 hypothetical protein VDGD_04567 [Verticillium dahliae]
MAPDSAANLTSLLRASSIDDHEEVLRAANAALKISKLDTGAQRTRVVALLKLDRFEDALRALADGGATLEADCRLEKAYALYKTGKLDDAASLAASTTGRSFSHVAAQVAYRAERFQDARQLYDELASDKAAAAEEESDLSINVLATAAQRDWQSQAALTSGFVQPPVAPALDTFELAYNLACGCIARGELSKASSLLQRASRLCDESDDLSDEEKRAEMAPILIQQAYVYSRLGNTTEALKLHRQLEASEISDAEARLVATNNASTLDNTASNPFAVQRTLEANPAVSNDAKLFHYQDSRLRRNKLALALRAQKFSGVARQTKHLISASSPSSTASSDANVLSVINVAARSLEHSSQVSLRDVLPAAERHPADVGVLLTAIQLHVLAKNYEAAVSLLEALFTQLEGQKQGDVRFSAGLVALAVALYRNQRRAGCATTELAKAIKYWNEKSDTQSASLLQGAGAELLKSTDADDLSVAGTAFEKLCQQSTADPIAVAGLIASFGKRDRSKVEPYLGSLPAVDGLVSNVDVQQLVEGGVAVLPATASSAKERTAEKSRGQNSRPQNKRKRKLPKDFEEGKKMDPERWLPLRDRSSYRPKGKKGKKKANDSTQGGFVKEEETLELAGGAGSVKVERAPTASSSSNKKKKKGKK